MIKNVLFDLDGTLLPMNLERFIEEYLKGISARVAHLVEPHQFLKHLYAATRAMSVSTDGTTTNKQVFRNEFFSRVGIAEEILIPIFDDFYAEDFPGFQATTWQSPAARRAVECAVNQGRAAVLATNPIFPLTAISQRIAWAGLDAILFSHVTSYENCHYCKPNPSYYLEIAEVLDCSPEECLMVGNDVVEDLSAAVVGMKTYLVIDCLVNPAGLEPKADYIGTLDELPAYLEHKLNGEQENSG